MKQKLIFWLNIFFSGKKWYRKWRGGTWVLVRPISFQEINIWLQDPNENFERIIKFEYHNPT